MQGIIRIIGGEWRGRKLKVPALPNLRPTPDRVRETLFNWLMPMITGAHCLDAFAGSGALGFEALSRGASQVVMVDSAREVVNLLKEEAAIFKTERADIYQAELPDQLKIPHQPFDIVFLDPPYSTGVLKRCCLFLEERGFLADEAHIYLEAAENIIATELPANWQIIKSKKTGQVAYHLVLRKKPC